MATSLAATTGSASTLRVAMFSVSTMSAGVPVGAYMANQVSSSKPFSVSAIGGTPGSSALSRAELTASGRSVPARIWPSAADRSMNMNCTWPLSTSAMACGGLR